MNKNLLILGSSGFFGKSLLNFIYQRKKIYRKIFKTITILSRQNRGNKEILSKLRKTFKIVYLKQDILNIKKIPKSQFIIYALLLDDIKKDYLAVKHFTKIIKNSKDEKNIVFTSSGAVYGKQLNKATKIKESQSLNNKFDFENIKKNRYAYFKLKSEKYLKNLTKKNFKITILRCFAFVGKDLPINKGFVVRDFISSIIKQKKIVVHSKNKVIRSYMHQDDLANWILTILLNNKKHYSIYNVGSDEHITIHNLGLLLSQKFNVEFKSNYCKSNYLDNYIPDISKAKKKFKLKLNYSNLSAICKTIDDIKKNYKKSIH